MSRTFFIAGAISGFFAVAAGAFGAHELKNVLSPEMFEVFETAVQYQFYHTFALLMTAMALDKYEHAYFSRAGWFFLAGIVLFSGSLYVLTLTGLRWMGAITPLGGVSLLTGWWLLGRAFWSVVQ
jgi:uncharacterized membrane protein YgdD (TMEM256/DUF423 family)